MDSSHLIIMAKVNDTSISAKHNYLNKDIEYLRNTSIIEYDIHSAGTCILYKLELISKETFDFLMNLNKESRNIQTGKILKDNPSWNKLQMREFSYIMELFMIENGLDNDDILSIKKDSIVVIGKIPKRLCIESIYQFNKVGVYNSYLYLKKKEIYLNSITQEYDLKNFTEEARLVQDDYFINMILSTLIINNDSKNKIEAFNHLKQFRSMYINLKLDEEYYYDIEKQGYVVSIGSTTFVSSTKLGDKTAYMINGNYSYLEDLINIILL